MSRRISIFVLAATATLIATQASADRECFEDTCRQLEAAETSAMQSPAAEENATPAPAPAAEASATVETPAPVKALPQVVAEPVAPKPVAPKPAALAPSVAAEASAPREPVRLAPRFVRQEAPPAPAPASAPVRVTDTAATDDIRAERLASPEPTYRPRGAVAAAPVHQVVASPGAIYAEDDVVRVYPNPRHDPAWKLCQLDARERDQRRCGAYSYHPYGENGYRPYGAYAAQSGTRAYLIAPNAKIIAVDSGD